MILGPVTETYRGGVTHTTADGLALALTSAARAVAAVAVGEEQTGTGGEENCKKAMSMRGLSWPGPGCVSRESRSQNVPPCFMGKPVYQNQSAIHVL